MPNSKKRRRDSMKESLMTTPPPNGGVNTCETKGTDGVKVMLKSATTPVVTVGDPARFGSRIIEEEEEEEEEKEQEVPTGGRDASQEEHSQELILRSTTLHEEDAFLSNHKDSNTVSKYVRSIDTNTKVTTVVGNQQLQLDPFLDEAIDFTAKSFDLCPEGEKSAKFVGQTKWTGSRAVWQKAMNWLTKHGYTEKVGLRMPYILSARFANIGEVYRHLLASKAGGVMTFTDDISTSSRTSQRTNSTELCAQIKPPSSDSRAPGVPHEDEQRQSSAQSSENETSSEGDSDEADDSDIAIPEEFLQRIQDVQSSRRKQQRPTRSVSNEKKKMREAQNNAADEEETDAQPCSSFIELMRAISVSNGTTPLSEHNNNNSDKITARKKKDNTAEERYSLRPKRTRRDDGDASPVSTPKTPAISKHARTMPQTPRAVPEQQKQALDDVHAPTAAENSCTTPMLSFARPCPIIIDRPTNCVFNIHHCGRGNLD